MPIEWHNVGKRNHVLSPEEKRQIRETVRAKYQKLDPGSKIQIHPIPDKSDAGNVEVRVDIITGQ